MPRRELAAEQVVKKPARRRSSKLIYSIAGLTALGVVLSILSFVNLTHMQSKQKQLNTEYATVVAQANSAKSASPQQETKIDNLATQVNQQMLANKKNNLAYLRDGAGLVLCLGVLWYLKFCYNSANDSARPGNENL